MKAEALAILRDNSLTDGARIVGLYLIEAAKLGEWIEVSHTDLSRVLHGYPSTDTIRRYVRQLAMAGYLEVKDGGRGHPQSYRVKPLMDKGLSVVKPRKIKGLSTDRPAPNPSLSADRLGTDKGLNADAPVPIVINKRINTEDNKNKPKSINNNTSWVAPFCSKWAEAFGGIAPGSRIGKALKPLKAKYDDGAILLAWVRYLEEVDAQFASPEQFASKYGMYANGSKKSDIDDIKTLIKAGGNALFDHWNREVGYEKCAAKWPELWARYETTMKAIRYADLRQHVENKNAIEYTNALKAQLRAIHAAA